MSQVDQFLEVLKKVLKSRGILYRDLASGLNLSESSVKRLLSSKDLSLKRIEEICRICDVSFAEVCKMAQFEQENEGYRLSTDQEKILSQNPRLLEVFILLVDGLSVRKILNQYQITKEELRKHLLQLDKIQLIELHEGDRVKKKFPEMGVFFNREGSVGKMLFDRMRREFLNSNFKSQHEYIRFSQALLKPEALNKFKKKFDQIVREIRDEGLLNKNSPEGSEEFGFLLAYRPWSSMTLNAIQKK